MVRFWRATRFRSTAKVSAVALVVGLLACAETLTDHFPPPLNPATSAEVFVLRDQDIILAETKVELALDRWVIAHMGPGEFVKFYLGPGKHSLAVAEADIIVNETEEVVDFQAAKTYYFVISPGERNQLVIFEISEDRAAKYLASYKQLE